MNEQLRPDKPVANLRPIDGPQLSLLLAGKTIGDVWTDGRVLNIRTLDGYEVDIAWVDEDGKPANGRPAFSFAGKRVRAKVGSMAGRGANLG